MSDNNFYDNNDTQYTQAPEEGYTQAPETTINGEPYTAEPVNYDSGKGQGNGFGIASMVCGILSIVACCIDFAPFILGVVAIVLGIIQIVKNEKKGMAIAGIVCGVVGIVLYALILVAGFAMLGAMGLTGNESPEEILEKFQMYQ